MSLLLKRVACLSESVPESIALRDATCEISYAGLQKVLNALRTEFSPLEGASVALVGDNSLAWAVVDLALLALPVRVVPIPGFFSAEQVRHVLQQASVQFVLGTADSVMKYGDACRLLSDPDVALCAVGAAGEAISQYEKVTFTSGSTGSPKGVRLALSTLEQTAQAIAAAMSGVNVDSHLSVLPYATLLENVAGLYAPLLQQVTINIRPLQQLGFNGANQFNVFALLQQLQSVQPQACILVPQLMMALVLACEKGFPVPHHFKFIAVGGGKVSVDLLNRAEALGLPVYEGYGLSECGSVVCLNRPGASRIGSVGQPLPQVQVHLGDDGEILVAGSTMLGYLGEGNASNIVATGDLGWRDEDGFIHISGRKKNMFITAFGRNVNPEWVEAELIACPAIAQAAVFGEAMVENVAIITVRHGFQWSDVEEAVALVNQGLPDYARVSRIIHSSEPFTVENEMTTANGRNRRLVIEQHYLAEISKGEQSVAFFDVLNEQTAESREYLLSAPVIAAVPEGRFLVAGYEYFLEQAFHHVKHTVPLMMACGGRLPQEKEWVRQALAEYIEDEYGHQEWILNDIAACGGDKESVRKGQPHFSIELMVSFLYDQIQRKNPMAFFGMVMVLEGTSIKLATQMGRIVQQKLDLPNNAFSYLYSHGELDVDHFEFFRNLMNRVEDPKDQEAIIHGANVVYRLYGDMLRSIPLKQQEPAHEAA